MLQEYDTVRLTKPIEGKSIPVGTKGAVLIDYRSNPSAYEVEFIADGGDSLGLVTLTGDYLQKAE
jgi:Domain of unknown function (DUF4926)